jgi:EpsI family protein
MILGLGTAFLAASRDQMALEPVAPLASIPASIGPYDGRDLTVSDAELAVAGVSEYLMREFARDSSESFSVYVGYYPYQTRGRSIHSPKNCLPGSGWEAFDTGVESVLVGGQRYTVNRYLLANGDARALVYYWYQGRGRVAANEYAVKWDLLRDAALYGRSEEALVRIVIPLPPSGGHLANRSAPDIAAADRIAALSAQALIPAVDGILPPWKKS